MRQERVQRVSGGSSADKTEFAECAVYMVVCGSTREDDIQDKIDNIRICGPEHDIVEEKTHAVGMVLKKRGSKEVLGQTDQVGIGAEIVVKVETGKGDVRLEGPVEGVEVGVRVARSDVVEFCGRE